MPGARKLRHDTHDSLTYQADSDGGDEDHDDLVDDSHGVGADDGHDAVGEPHSDEEEDEVQDECGGDGHHDDDLAVGGTEMFVVGFAVCVYEEQAGGHGSGPDDEGDCQWNDADGLEGFSFQGSMD